MTLNVFNACTAKKLAINLQYELLTSYIILGYPFLCPIFSENHRNIPSNIKIY
ncbi:hypothetical protein RhiirC2_753912 [Rhizophagus irregularis]|uniref:Uncharacterized protein n=1 Tax=Rhizophagus irregularis TaxID=588596 RepID=A0A2N1MWY8_9GLOM|nr:hypothetical protein RhiirC2_753912 [Rhizophagus irregularis]